MTTKPAILFVCLGNICRSPMAEGAMRDAVAKAGLDIIVDSAGTADYHRNEAPDPRAIQTARSNGVDISNLYGRQLVEEDFHRFTHIFAMDKANLAAITSRAPHNRNAHISLLLDLVPGREGEALNDPYYGEADGFAECWQTINLAVDALVAQLSQQSQAA